MVNDFTFNQSATILKSITEQATGQKVITPTNTSEFVSVGTTALKAGYDPLNTAISQVLSNTIFSVRPYSAKFKGMQVSEQRYGNVARKLSIADKEPVADQRFNLIDGQPVTPSMYTVSKPSVLQENFYGANAYSRYYTIYKDQLDCAFRSADEFARFISMVVANTSDMIEQDHEVMARMTLANLIGGVYVGGKEQQKVHLLTEYNTETGLNLSAQDVYKPENYKPFMLWALGRITTISNLLTERGNYFHMDVDNKIIARHSPVEYQKLYISASNKYSLEKQILTEVFNDKYAGIGEQEVVNFWQSIDKPHQLQVTPSYLANNGNIATPSDPVTIDNLFAVITDRDSAGYTVVNRWSSPTPLEASGGYTNYWYHFTDKFWNSFTENCVIFLLD